MLFAIALAACGEPPPADTDTSRTTPSTNGDPCDGVGVPSVILGSGDDPFAPWTDEVRFAPGTGLPGAVLEVGIAAPNLVIPDFTYVRLVALDGTIQLFDSSIPSGFTCDAALGPLGLLRVDWDWPSVEGHEVRFEATITDDDGESATGEATVTVRSQQ